MMEIALIGWNSLARAYVDLMEASENMQIIAILPDEEQKNDESLAEFDLHRKDKLESAWLNQADYIFICDDNASVAKKVMENNTLKADVFTERWLRTMQPLLSQFLLQANHFELILNNISDGLIVIQEDETIAFVNEAAVDLIGKKQSEMMQCSIRTIIPNSRLPKVLQHQEKEVNQPLTLANSRQIISTRVPLINEQNRLVGAFAIFKDSNEVLRLAEENTDLKEIKTMLEAIIHSSDEAISVVDEHGNGLMINPAYTRITGLTEKQVIGMPATVDISEGESMHFHVLETRRPVRGVKMKVGPHKKEVLVNVAPIIVAGKLKGSVAVIHDISEIKELTTALKKARQMIRNLEATYTFDDIIGSSPEMMIAIEQAKIGAKTPATVLLRGSSGTGKELFAHAIHNESDRKYNKFIRVNCAALAASVLESELFGYEEGAFTGAKAGGKKGLFEEANMGSIFLDEIGELSLHMQAKLLRVLQEKEVLRVGGTTPIPLDIRIITATNVNLEKAVTNGTFREDLYYRLNRLPIYIPLLQERMSDLHELAAHLITKVNQQYGRNVSGIEDAAMRELRSYHWPGNIRELENVISRAIIFMDVTEETIQVHHLPELTMKELRQPKEATIASTNQTLQMATDQFEKKFIRQVYEENDYHKTNTAKQLHISVRNLYYKLEKYGLDK